MTAQTQLSPRVAALVKKTQAARGRLIFAIDATGSREATWDVASHLQAGMFEEAARIGGLDVQLVHFGSHDNDNAVRASPWFSDAHELVAHMGPIRCSAGPTRIAQVLKHIRDEHEREKISAAIFIGDACEELPSELYAAASDLRVRAVPAFMFQEGAGRVDCITTRGELVGETVEHVFCEIARETGGAYGKFDAGAARQLGDMLRAVAAFATGGLKALAGQHTDSARRLLNQLK